MYRGIGIACMALLLSYGCFAQPDDETVAAAMKAALLEDAKATPETYTGKAYLIGTLDGTLAPALNTSIEFTPYNGTATDGPIFLSQSGLTSLNATDKAGVIATFQARVPIILVNADEAAVNSLIEILHGQRFRFVKPPKAEYVELFAIDTEPNGNVYHWAMYPPANTAEDPDGQGDQQARVNYLVTWLKEDGQRDIAEQAARAAAADLKDGTAYTPSQSLTTATAAFTKTDSFSQYGNTYQITHYIWGCHSTTTGDDWLYVQQRCALSGSGAYQGKVAWYQGGSGAGAFWYLNMITLDSSFAGFDHDAASVSIPQSAPPTTTGVTTVSSRANYAIVDNVLVGDSSSVTAVPSGVAINNTVSFGVTGCTINNLSGSRSNNASWSYQFNTCETIADWAYADLADPPSLAITTFSPVNQWVWRLSPSVRTGTPTPPIHVTLDVKLAGTTGKQLNWNVAYPVNQFESGGSWEWDVSFEYPPTALPTTQPATQPAT